MSLATESSRAGGPVVRLSEVIGALSYALDLTEGQPMGHAARSCAIGMRLAEVVGVPGSERSTLFYALLMKDAGCSTNASKIAQLYGADDREVKRVRKTLDQHRPRQLASHLLRSAAPGGSPVAKAGRIAALVLNGSDGSRALTALRCERGADIARMVGLGEVSAEAIRTLDEHWDGSGGPVGLAGHDIPLFGRILCLSQTVEVFAAMGGARAACEVARARSGRWFDPDLVDALGAFEHDEAFWDRLAGAEEPALLVGSLEPDEAPELADEDRLDRIAEAFAKVIDAKSPYTRSHSDGVARIAASLATRLGHAPHPTRLLRRAGLLHDVGKLGVSSLTLDKPSRLDEAEWAEMRRHPAHTYRILMRVGPFRALAPVASAHHEKLDGSGYHRGLTAERLSPGARILAVADVFEALTATRPYREALGLDEVLAIIARDVPHKLDATVFAALQEDPEGA